MSPPNIKQTCSNILNGKKDTISIQLVPVLDKTIHYDSNLIFISQLLAHS